MLGADVLVLELGGELEGVVEHARDILAHRRLEAGLAGHFRQTTETFLDRRPQSLRIGPQLAQQTLGDPLGLRQQGLEEVQGRNLGVPRAFREADGFLEGFLALYGKSVPSHPVITFSFLWRPEILWN